MRKRVVALLGLCLNFLYVFSCSYDATPAQGSSHLSSTSSARPAVPLSLIGRTRDANGFLLNPDWTFHVQSGRLPDPVSLCGGRLSDPNCSAATSTDLGRQVLVICAPASGTSLNGHVNYEIATFTGRIRWLGAEPSFLDGDYNFSLRTPGLAGLTTGNANGEMDLEFAEAETIRHFGSEWWRSLRSAVRQVDTSRARDMIDGRFAVVTGLLGLDCVHNCHAELHPVYAFAMRTDLGAPSANDDSWVLFARNVGNEGFCSRAKHQLPAGVDRLNVQLPWFPGADAVHLLEATEFHADNQADAVRVVYERGKSVSVQFDFAPRDLDTVISGQLHLAWAAADGQQTADIAQAGKLRTTARPTANAPEALVPQGRRSEIAGLPAKLDEGAELQLLLPPDQLAVFEMRMAAQAPEAARRRDYRLSVPSALQVTGVPTPIKVESVPRAVSDPSKEQFDAIFSRELNLARARLTPSVPLLPAPLPK